MSRRKDPRVAKAMAELVVAELHADLTGDAPPNRAVREMIIDDDMTDAIIALGDEVDDDAADDGAIIDAPEPQEAN